MYHQMSHFASIITVACLVGTLFITPDVQCAKRVAHVVDQDIVSKPEKLTDSEKGNAQFATDVTTEDPPGTERRRISEVTTTTEMADELSDRAADEVFASLYNTTNEVDLVFVVDRSGSVPRTKWNSTIQFIMNVLENFTVDKDNTRVAVITYSTTVSVDFDDLEPNTKSDEETKCTVQQRLENILLRKLPHGYTATYDALVSVYKSLLNSRPRARKAVIIITDGKSNIGPPPLKAAVDILSLRWQQVWDPVLYGPQVEIFVFGVEEVNIAELKSIASSFQNHVFIMSTFRHFAHLAHRIHGGSQHAGWSLTRVFNCGGMCNGPHMYCVCGTSVGRYACVCEEGFEMRGTSCEPCSLGSYKETKSPDGCKSCPENMTTKNIGSTLPSACVLKPGYVVCPDLPDVEHASKFYVAGTALDEVPNTGTPCTKVTDGNSCHYACSVGYRLTGSPVMTCNYSGIWDGEIPSCKIIDCHRIEHFYEQWVGMSVNYINYSTTFNSMVEVSCRDGTMPSNGETSWTCDSQGQWSSSWNFQCREIYCGPLMLSNNVEVSSEICQRNRVPLDTHCQMQCGYGFDQTGPTDFYCIHENGTPQWSPDTGPVCRDVLPPKIVCPSKVEVFVSDWNQNSTIIYYDKHKPYISDNSGEVTFEIRGAPEDKQFPIGNTVLVYEAIDAAGNRAACMRYISVKGRSVVVKSCPPNITATVTSLQRTSQVIWPDPVFIGPDDTPLPFTCSTQNGREFLFGVYFVICYPDSHPAISCEFQINVTDPPCPIPHEDRAPVNGALICGTSSLHYPKICRIHCREGYELRNYEAKHKFVCHWDGTWNLEGERWPDCVRTRRPAKILIENELHVRFSGVCHESQRTITEAFNSTIRRVLESEHGPCPSNHLCKIEDIQVRCGHVAKRSIGLVSARQSDLQFQDSVSQLHSGNRIRRGIAGDASRLSTSSKQLGDALNPTVRFQMSVEVLNKSDFAVTRTDQLQLLDTWEEVFYNISDSVAAGRLKYKIGTSVAEATSLRETKRRFKTIRCPKSEVQTKDDISAVCYSCEPGSYLVNQSCELCPIGKYQPNESWRTCRSCPAGTSTKYSGARTHADCVGPCLPGHFSKTGLEACDPCTEGTFQDNPGSTVCKKCPKELNTLSVGSKSITDCVEFLNCKVHGVQCNGGVCFRKDELSTVECFCPEELSSCQGVSNSSLPAVVCLNNGVYVHLSKDHFGCQCPPEFSGKFCESRLSGCDSLPCQNGGTCVDHSSYFICQCPVEYSGDLCDSKILVPSSLGIIPVCSEADNFGKCSFQADRHSNPDFDVIFSTLLRENETPLLRWVLSRSFGSLTASMWLRSSESQSVQSTLLSFNVVEGLSFKVNMSFKENSDSKLVMEQTAMHITLIFNLHRSVWHHLMIEWIGLTGFWRVFVNGSFVDEVHVPSTNDFIAEGSVLQLGESFNGEMSQFALLDQPVFRGQMMNSSDIYAVGQCHGVKGNLVQWTDILQLLPSKSASMSLRNGSWCMDVDECLYSSLHKCKLSEQCVDLKDSWSCQPCDQSSIGGKCPDQHGITTSGPCDVLRCQNNGSCSLSGACICQSGYTGTFCETPMHPVQLCDPNPCLNGGFCLKENNSAVCRCQENWTGKYCQISHSPSCELSPCVNNGSCVVVVQSNWRHYRCICPELGRPLGANCEFLAVCDTLPCMNGGKCVNLDSQKSYYCMCSINYTGQNCDSPVSLSPLAERLIDEAPSSVDNFCRSVDCHNGGSCINKKNGFQCKCPRDYKGQYCDKLRLTETKKFQVKLSLLHDYDSRLNYDLSFQENFRLQVHHAFADIVSDQKMYVVINDIRKGNSNKGIVLVDFTIIITFYLDSIVIGSDAVWMVFVQHMMNGKLGSLPVSFDDFHFEPLLSSTDFIAVESSDRTVRYVMLIALAIVVATVLFILLCWHRNRFSRIFSEIMPFCQVLSNLWHLVVISDKLQPHQENENIVTISGSKQVNKSTEKRFTLIPR